MVILVAKELNNSKRDEQARGNEKEILAEIIAGSISDLTNLVVIDKFVQKDKVLDFEIMSKQRVRIISKRDKNDNSNFPIVPANLKSDKIRILGFNKNDQKNLKKYAGQSEVVSNLARLLYPEKLDFIQTLIKPKILCVPKNRNYSTIGLKQKSNSKNPRLKQVGILNFENLNKLCLPLGLKPRYKQLEFYLNNKIESFETEFVQNDIYKVIASNDLSSNDFVESSKDNSYDKLLIADIPFANHSSIENSNLDLEKYEFIHEIYQYILFGSQFFLEYNSFFGYSEAMQACVTYDAKRSFNKIPFSQKMEYNNDEEWVLLYQLVPTFSSSFFKMTSDPAIYFMIRKTDLENWNFENVQLIFQRD